MQPLVEVEEDAMRHLGAHASVGSQQFSDGRDVFADLFAHAFERDRTSTGAEGAALGPGVALGDETLHALVAANAKVAGDHLALAPLAIPADSASISLTM